MSNIKHGQELKLKGLYGRVRIGQDCHGVPYIHALDNDLDTFFSLGFLHARDRLLQMEIQRRIAQGRLSEIFGKSTINDDKILRTWGLYHAASHAFSKFDDKTKEIINSYTQGINAFITLKKLPFQFKILRHKPEPWTSTDSIVWQKIMALNLEKSWEDKIKNYLVLTTLGKEKFIESITSYPKTGPTTIHDEELSNSQCAKHQDKIHLPLDNNYLFNNLFNTDYTQAQTTTGIGSNAWVISGKYTATKKPILACDPHLTFLAPNIWYLASLKGPKIKVNGGTIPGLPAVMVGHNQHIAWGLTTACADTQDVFIVEPDQDLTIRQETIRVRGSKDIVISIKHHGTDLIIDQMPGGKHDASIRWPVLNNDDKSVQTFILLNYAENWSDFKNALENYTAPVQNFIYADIEGNIGYHLAGKIPIRENIDPRFPAFAKDIPKNWEYIPFDLLPHVFNPEKGYIVNANNKIVTEQYPYAIASNWHVPPYRAQRIIDLIHNKNDIDLQDVANMQTDIMSYLWLDLKDILLATKAQNSNSQQALDILTKWDGYMRKEGIESTLFAYWFRELSAMIYIPNTDFHWSEALFIKKQLNENSSFCITTQSKDAQEYLSVTLKNAIDKLHTDRGSHPKKWQWGQLHYSYFSAYRFGLLKWFAWLGDCSMSTSGGKETVNVGGYDNQFKHLVGAGYRQVIDLDNLDNSLFIQALGQSENPFHKHYTNLLKLWANGEFIKLSSTHEDYYFLLTAFKQGCSMHYTQ